MLAWKMPTVIIGDVSTIVGVLFAINTDIGIGIDPQHVIIRDKDSNIIDINDLPDKFRNIKIHGELTDYRDFIKEHSGYYYIISLEAFRGNRRDSIVKLLENNKIKYAVVPIISRMGLYQSRPLYFFGNDVMMMEATDYHLNPFQKCAKRLVDILGSVIGLVLFSVPIIFVAICLKKEKQGGTIFYGGSRIGENGKEFKCWKLRTMEPDSDHLLEQYLENNPQAKADWERYFKLSDDPRVQTKTAKFIRKTSIDELPQLWNVLKGDMSLVGPRPILPSEKGSYGDKYNEYISVKPGLTGLWQVSGRNQTSFYRRVVWDGWYVRNWSFWGDIVIIIKTIYVVLARSGAS